MQQCTLIQLFILFNELYETFLHLLYTKHFPDTLHKNTFLFADGKRLLCQIHSISLKQYLNSFYRDSLDKKLDVATSSKDLMISPLFYIKLHERVFMHYTRKKNLYCFRQSGQFQQLELKYMAIDLGEVYICLLD